MAVRCIMFAIDAKPMLSLVRKIWIYLAAGLCLLGPIALGILSLALLIGGSSTGAELFLPYIFAGLALVWFALVERWMSKFRSEEERVKADGKLLEVVLLWLAVISLNMLAVLLWPDQKLGFTIGSVILMTQLGEYRSLPKSEREKAWTEFSNLLQGSQPIREHPRPEDQ